MKKDIIADINPHETRIALLEDGELEEIQIEMRGQERLVGNIYKGRVENVLPGMQAAFVDVGLERNAFLYAGDILQSAKLRECVEVSEQKKKKDKDKNAFYLGAGASGAGDNGASAKTAGRDKRRENNDSYYIARSLYSPNAYGRSHWNIP